MEYRTAAIYHACGSILTPLNNFYNRFLRDLGISAEHALIDFNLAPLSSRRDMAMMGLLHRASIGKGPEHFKAFFRLPTAKRHCTRLETRRNSRQLVAIRNEHFLETETPSASEINLGVQQAA